LVATLFILPLLLPAVSPAKDLNHRLGVGYGDQTGVNVPSLRAKYFVDRDFALSADLGIQTGDNDSAFGLLVKAYKTIFPEDNLNFYLGGGAGLVSQKLSKSNGGDGTNNSGFELMAFAGAEFFLPGLDSIGISFEAGFGVLSIRSDTSFRTIADSPLKAGMVFYF
jgi:hypothetical protein